MADPNSIHPESDARRLTQANTGVKIANHLAANLGGNSCSMPTLLDFQRYPSDSKRPVSYRCSRMVKTDQNGGKTRGQYQYGCRVSYIDAVSSGPRAIASGFIAEPGVKNSR